MTLMSTQTDDQTLIDRVYGAEKSYSHLLSADFEAALYKDPLPIDLFKHAERSKQQLLPQSKLSLPFPYSMPFQPRSPGFEA